MAEIVVKLVNGELAGKTAQGIAKEVNAAALALKKAEVGTKDWVAANEKLTKAKALQGDLRKQIEGTAKASDMLKNAWNKLPGAQFFNQIASSFGMAKQGVGGLISSMGMLKGAIAATGIGALVLVIASLVSWFAKTDEGATKLDGIMRAIGNTVDVLMNRLINLKETLFTLFTNPGKFFRGLVADIQEGIDLGQELADTFDNLDQARRDMELVDAKNSNKLQQLLLQSKNVGLSYQERLDKLKEADAIEMENYKQKLKYAQDFAAAVDKETAFQQKQGTITDEQLDKQNQAKIKLLEIEGDRINVEEKIANRREQLLDKQNAEIEKQAAKREKDNEKFLKDQEKFYEEQNKRQLQQDLYQENRRVAEAEKEKKRIQASMAEAAKKLAADVAGFNTEADERKKLNDAIIALEHEKLSVFNEGVTSVVMLLAADEAARKKNANAIKFFESGRVAVNGLAEISEIAKTFAALGPIGQILAAARIAFSGIRTAAAIKRINSQKFEHGGGVLNGPRHAQGGIPIEAEGGEFIFSRKAVRAIGTGTLNRLNNAYTFANGGPVNPYSNSGMGSSSPGRTPGSDPLGMVGDLKNAFMSYAEEVRTWQRNLQVTNNLQDTSKGLSVLNQLKSEADV
jgi:hypothetical protein